MNLWAWVFDQTRELREMGRDDLADAFDGLPHRALHGDLDGAVATAPMLLAAAEELDRPWIAVFVRHWLLQGRAKERCEGRAALSDAVDALERANRPDTVDCPQSVCTTQDLSLCYGRTDGPGWANERLSVVQETIARIDPTWSCWECMAHEHASALEDLGRLDESREVILRVGGERAAAGVSASSHFLNGTAARHLRLGDPQLALDLLDQNPELDAGEISRDADRLVRIVALLRLGRADELPRLPPASDGGDPSETLEPMSPDGVGFMTLSRHLKNAMAWTEAAEELVAAGLLTNGTGLGVQIRRFVEESSAVGSDRNAWTMAGSHVRLAAARGARWVASRGLALASAARDELRDPSSVDGDLAALAAVVAGLPPTTLPVPAAELLGHMASLDRLDVEQAIDWLDVAVGERPDDLDLLRQWALVGQMLGGVEAVVGDLTLRLSADPSQSEVADTLLGVLMQADAEASRFDELATLIAEVDPGTAWWARANAARRRRAWADCIAACREILRIDPDALNTRRLGAFAAREMGDHPAAMQFLHEVCDRAEPGPDDWAHMEVATMAGDWASVRWSARRLGMDVDEGSEPIDERWGLMYVRPQGGSAEGRDDLMAVRTGPVTAEVLTITPPGQARQRAGDVVVFEASPIDEPPADGDPDWRPTFPEAAVLTEGGRRAWWLFGVRPSDELWAAAGEVLDEANLWFSWYCSPSARIVDAEGSAHPAIYGAVAAGPGVEPAAVAAVLRDVTAAWPGPISWPQLADEVAQASPGADPAELDRHWACWNGFNFE